MYFESVGALLAMDGHGPYVWSAYGITMLVLLVLIVAPRVRQRRLMRELTGEARRRDISADSSAGLS